MKHTLRILLVIGLCGISLMGKSQTSNVRGLYLPGADSWIGNTTTENAILSYVSGNAYNYIAFYSLGSFAWTNTTKKNQLADFIRRAKTTYGVTQVGATGESYSFFRDYIIPYNNGRSSASEKFDVLNYEFEWWVSSSVTSLYCSKYLTPAGCSCDTAGAWRFSWPQFQSIDSLAAANNLTSEYYFGWPSSGRMAAIATRADRILLHAYRTSDADVYQYSRSRLIDAASNNQTVKIIPIFSAESSFMGPWLNSNPITKPYQTYSNNYASETGSFKQYINLQGYQWFNYDHLPKTTTAVAAITASGPTTFCTGGSVTLTANSGSAYLWSPGNQTTQSITVSAGGSYTVRVTNSSGASAVSSPVVVSVVTSMAAPTVTASGPTSFCQGGSVTLTSSTATTYRWSNNATTQSITVTSGGNYKVTVTSGGCTATSSNTTVSITTTAPTPTVTASSSLSICPGSTVKLTSSQASSYVWSTGATTREIIVGSSGTYWVKGYGGPNCFAQSSNVVTTLLSAPTKPVITPSGSTSLTSSNSSVSLSCSSANSYSWSTGDATRSITVSTAGSYRVSVSSSNGCSSTSDAVQVTASGCTPPAPPTITSSSTNNVITSGQTVTLTSSTAGGYLWSNGSTARSITVSTAGTYTVRAYSSGSCFSTSLPTTVYVVWARHQPASEAGYTFDVYPNPATDLVRMNVNSPSDEPLQLTLTDLSGRIVYNQLLQPYAGQNTFELMVNDLPRGAYLAAFSNEEVRQTVRLMLQ